MNVSDEDILVRCEALICGGEAAKALNLLLGLPDVDRDRRARLLIGDAHRTAGDNDAALAAYAHVEAGPADAAMAWRVGQVYLQQYEPRRALEVYADVGHSVGDPVDRAWLQAGIATARWQLGDENALTEARAAQDLAVASGDLRVLAAAHIALGLTVSLNGDPATVDEEYARAARYASAAGDLVQGTRIAVNRSHHLLADARFAEAVEVAAAGGATAERIGSTVLLGIALGNEAEGLVRLGRHDEAVERCERALSLAVEIGTRRTAGALVVLARIHLRRGCREQARAALEQALRLHATDPDRQVRVPALACLALAHLPEDLISASRCAYEALAEATGSARLPALLAAGRTALARGEADTAGEHAGQAVEHARRRRERAWLAEALELRAAVDNAVSRTSLREAHQIWREAGAAHDADRVLVHLARLSPTSLPDRLAGRLAAARLESAELSETVPAAASSSPRVQISTFGRFEVLVDGVVVPPEEWQSRRARELLRLLVCRRGRTMPRLEICEVLWPDDDPLRTTHRLSVLLSIVRGIVGADALVADQACVALDHARVDVDVEHFLTDVADGLALHERGAAVEAGTLLAEAVRRYTDEPFADTPYEDATTALRDEAKGALLAALRLLAKVCRQAGESDRAAAYLRRLLAEDNYDEDAHRLLLAVLNRSGRHGQARVAAARYRTAMSEIGLRPAV